MSDYHGLFFVDIFSIMVCLILLYGSIFETRKRTARTKLYILLTFSCLLGTCFDALSLAVDGKPNLAWLNSVFSSLALFGTLATSMVLFQYVIAYGRENQDVKKGFLRLVFWFYIGFTALTAAGCFSGALFRVENGCYEEGPLYLAYLVGNLLMLIPSVYMIGVNRKYVSRHGRVALYSFLVLPVADAVINMFDEKWSFGYPSIAIGCLLVYVMLQSEHAQELKEAEQISQYQANHDEMTGLLNRRAYEDQVRSLSGMKDRVAVIFCDLNGLKFANDHYGHEAGDRLIIRFSRILMETFRKRNVYRISGDEFVILMPQLEIEAFHVRFESLRRRLADREKEIASVGAAYGSCREIVSLVKEAEDHMYDQKKEFYSRHPEMKR